MKRMSKAEEALSKQVKSIEAQIQAVDDEMQGLRMKRSTLATVRDSLENEISHLHQTRVEASKRAGGQ